LIDHIKKMATIFGSTYAGIQLISSMKEARSKLRAKLTDITWKMFRYLPHSTYHLNFRNVQTKN